MKHSVSLVIGILDPLKPSPRIAHPVTLPHWFAALLLLMVGVADLIGRVDREVSYQVGWLARDMVAWIDWVTLVMGVWLRLPAPVVVWGVG